jgi:lipopolysaccharide/colanic/teichoic acid biosynthesis glycosyltransferase
MASLQFRDEDGLLSVFPADSCRKLSPEKFPLDMECAGQASFCSDTQLLLRTFVKVIR